MTRDLPPATARWRQQLPVATVVLRPLLAIPLVLLLALPALGQRPPPRPNAATKIKARGTVSGGIKTTQGTTAAGQDSELQRSIAAAERRCLGQTIERTAFVGCLGTRCENEADRPRFIRLSGLEPGVVVTKGLLDKGRLRLEKTRFFRVQSIRCRTLEGKAGIRIAVAGNQFIRRVKFVGNHALFTDELRNKVQLQPGDVLNPGTDETKRALTQQQQSLENVYAREGFDDVKIKVEVRIPEEEKRAPSVQSRKSNVSHVELWVTIDEGDRKRVVNRTVTIADRHVPTAQERDAGLICRTVSERALLRQSGLNEVDVFTRRAGVRAKGRIRERLRGLGYNNPKVAVNHVEASQKVHVRIQLGRCNIVRLMERESIGQAHANATWRLTDDDDYHAVLPFAQSGVFDIDEADRGRRALRALLENRGYLFSEVELEVRDVPRAWKSRVQRAITYRISTGYQAQIRGMRFSGVKHFTSEQIYEAVVTRPYDFFDDGGYLQTAQLLGDLARLRQLYRDAGFFEFRYAMNASERGRRGGIVRRRKRVGGQQSIDILMYDRGFRVRRPIGEHFIYIDVPLTEGRRTRLGDLQVGGSSDRGQQRARKLMGLNRGDVLSFSRMVKGLRKVEDWYQEHGYFQAKVEVLCRVKGAAAESLTARVMTPVDPCERRVPPVGAKCPPKKASRQRCSAEQEPAKGVKKAPTKLRECRPDDWCACTKTRILSESVDLRLEIVEGPRVRIGEIFVSGNFTTHASLLMRDMPKYGSLYSGQALFVALRKIRNLGLFRSVSFDRIGADECPPRKHVAMLVRVVENDHNTVDFDAGFQTANLDRSAAQSTGEPPALFVDILDHFVSAGARLTSGSGQRVGAKLPNLVLTASADARLRNFRGLGQELRFVTRGGVSSNPDDYKKRWISLGLVAVSWTIPRIWRDVSLRVVPFASRDFVTTTVDIDKLMVAADVSKRFLKHLAVSIGGEGGLVRYRKAEDSANLTPWLQQYKLIPRASWDRLDSPLNPTRGFSATASLAYINAVVETVVAKVDANGDPELGADGTPLFVRNAEPGNFLKAEGQFKFYRTLRNTFTLGLMVRGGVANEGLPANETFRLGGQLGLRGVKDNGVLQYQRNGEPKPLMKPVQNPEEHVPGGTETPVCLVDSDPSSCPNGAETIDNGRMILAGTVEGRFPLIRRAGLWGAVFWDWGAIADDFDGLSYSQAYRHSIGVGLRFLVSGQIPLRIDYGIALDRRCTIHFSQTALGNCPSLEEFGQLQAGLLYSF
ncbi:MAG: BamA/TamA family outer membrane protein [Myxococcales bacterium]|nr:BamA/TamA family outer membrane protein [Myxococcales bacterium]